MPRRSWALFILSALFLALGSVGSLANDVRVIFVTHGQPGDPYWEIIKNGMNEAAAKLGDTVEYRSPATFSNEEMKRLIAEAVASRPDGLVVSIPDEAALGASVADAIAAGVPVILIDSGGALLAKKLGALFFMGQSEFGAGIEAGRRARALNVRHPLCVDHEVGNVSLEARCHGFGSGLGMKVPVLETTLQPAVVRKNLVDYLAANPETDLIVTLGAASAEVALDVVRERPKDRRPMLGTFDMSANVLAAVASGEILWAIDAQPYLMGYVPVVTFDLLKHYKLKPAIPDAFYPTGPSFVGKEDALAMQSLSAQGFR
ncbi:sugar ABC transporter substrate-binding protein [Dongia sp.]|uniref:sugar ABC transporter substrate-binding protein n=1 Tax=Dongia sp. TaxID=1977262 RepID=UPI0035B307A0